jgi:Na+(H+)/acetate symporter ActP
MRAITFVQAFQYWLKLTALAVPVFFLLIQWNYDGRPDLAPEQTTFSRPTTVELKQATTVTFPREITVRVRGEVDGEIVNGSVALAEGAHTVAGGTTMELAADDPVPAVSRVQSESGDEWLLPGGPESLFAAYSLILATFLGTMGLPHVLVRFYTNPDGAAARRTTLVVLGLVGLFYLFPTLYGVLGRIYVPQLLITGQSDAVVLLLPGAALGGGTTGQLLGALVAAGAFAAFLSTSSGLLTSVAGVLSTDVLGRGSVRDFRRAAVVAGVIPLILALRVSGLDVSQVVGLAFAVAASSFCPLLVLGIWWRGLTAAGAAAGVIVGGGAAVAAVLVTVLGGARGGWIGTLLAQPAAWTVPLAFAVMIIVSLATRRQVPESVGATMLRLHAPDALRM